MEARKLLEVLQIAERLKDATRHCYTKNGRHESVAEHSWMMTLMAYFMKDEFPQVDMNKVIQMCIIHDLGECFTGDIPTFDKTKIHEENEETLLYSWVRTLPENYANEMISLYEEMTERKTIESKIYKAIDGLEALIQHNISDLSTWIPKEFELNKTYADDKVDFSEYLKELREEIRKDTLKKIEKREKKKVAFICVHNSCRSQIAEALGKHLASDVFESFSAGTETKPQINQDAVRIMKEIYGIDMEQTQYSKLISDIPNPDVAISMGCNVGCPFIGRAFDDNWGLEDPTGKSDEEFIKIIREIESRILQLKNELQSKNG